MPVTIHDGRLDMLAFNTAAADLFGPLFDDGPYGRNIAYQAFTATGLDKVLGNEGAEQLARVATAELRKALSHYSEDEYLRSLFRELSTTKPEFDRHWQKGEIGNWSSAMKHVNHPTKGPLAFDSEMLHDPENDHWVMLFAPPPHLTHPPPTARPAPVTWVWNSQPAPAPGGTRVGPANALVSGSTYRRSGGNRRRPRARSSCRAGATSSAS
ncbi:hypothetical protein [Streptomyces sp. NPDC091212]|uniref:MmyB family transcriptional regulator n=1 Tax=Streptomyces sp. NPDC091212 TaxID=3155191 RepID=UPI0034191B83